MKNQIWGYIRYLLLGIITAAVLLWSLTAIPAAADVVQIPSSAGQSSSILRHSGLDPESRFLVLEILNQVQDDEKKQKAEGKGLALSLPFSVDSHWTSVSGDTPGIVWTVGDNETKFGIQNGRFIPGDTKTDTWFVYGWFGTISAIKQPYNVKYPEWGDRHNGIDFAGQEGTPVTSASTGTVIFAGKKIGNTVIINAGNGYQITYGHLQDISIKKGKKVKVGTLIGHLGKTGTTNPHLHFQVDYIKKGVRRAINPVPLLDTEWGSVVIPVAEANQFYTDNQNPFTQPDFSW